MARVKATMKSVGRPANAGTLRAPSKTTKTVR